MSNIFFVKPDSPEWHIMWEKLSQKYLNADQENPYECSHHGERWQYMGSVNKEDNNLLLIHQFRHRCHPVTNKREYYNILSYRFAKELLKREEITKIILP